MSKPKFKPIARHKARRLALQALYQWKIAGGTVKELVEQYLADDTRKVDVDYFKKLLQGVIEHVDSLDEKLRPTTSRPLNELDPIEHVVLLIAVYELLNHTDIPYRVVINEALQLVKSFGAQEGHLLPRSDRPLRRTRAGQAPVRGPPGPSGKLLFDRRASGHGDRQTGPAGGAGRGDDIAAGPAPDQGCAGRRSAALPSVARAARRH